MPKTTPKVDTWDRVQMVRNQKRSRLPKAEHDTQMSAAKEAAGTDVIYQDLTPDDRVIFTIDVITPKQKFAARKKLQEAGYAFANYRSKAAGNVRGWVKV